MASWTDPKFRDAAVRQAAFAHVRRLALREGVLESETIRAGFTFEGRRWPLINPQRGIFKPQDMLFLLSIRTVIPRKGARVWYDDQTQVHEQIYKGQDGLDYAFMGTDPQVAENQWLRQAAEHQIPIIYFLGVAPGRYQALLPTFILDWNPQRLSARIGFAELDQTAPAMAAPDPAERRYALRQVKQRLHQASFRERVIAAYDGRCAISSLPEPRLIDAAHIMADADEALGQPLITNGLALSRIHHAAFDSHLIGIDPDGIIHLSEQLLTIQDGPFLEHGIKSIAGSRIRLPKRAADRPDRDRLAQRYEEFRHTA